MMKLAIGAAAALLAVNSASCCFLTDTDYPGHDIDRLEGKVYSSRDCQQLCQGLSACAHFTYQPSTNSCYLKKEGGAPFPSPGLISGPRVCPGPVDCSKEGIDLYGGDLINTTVASPLACQHQCSAVAGCMFWTFLHATSRCYLKGDSVEPRPLPGAVSGPRVCPSVSPITCEESVDFKGHDIRSFLGSVSDVEKCQQLCKGFNNCFYFTFVASTASCYLKDAQAAEGREINPLTFSGARECDLSVHPTHPLSTSTTTPPPSDCLLPNVDFHGADIFAFGLGAVTKPEACQLMCQYTPGCHYFTYYEGSCYFKAADAPQHLKQKEGAVSGPKHCSGAVHTPETTTSTAATTTAAAAAATATATTTTPPITTTTQANNQDASTLPIGVAEAILKFLKAQNRS